MHFGIFLEERRPGTSEAAAFQETLDLAEAAEASGLDGVWLGEIHFNPTRSVHSAPIALASYIAARTRRVRIGTAVQGLPLGNPLRIAEDVGPVDHLRRGRFGVALGPRGLPLFVGLRDLSIPELRSHLAAYRAAWREAGHSGDGDVCLRIPVYIGATEEEAVEEPRENTIYFFRRHAELTRAGLGRADTGPTDRRQARLAELTSLSYDDILETRVAFGTARSLTDRLARLRDELRLDGIVAELNPSGQFPLERMHRTLRLLTREVIPALT